MRRPSELSRDELIGIVESLQGILYLDVDTQGEFWNPDKSWNGADVCNELARVLERHVLVPGTPAPVAQPKTRYLLYDLDADALVTSRLYDDPEEAFQVANQLDDVIVVTFSLD